MTAESMIERIQSIYHSCSLDEQKILIQILQEIADTGESTTYRDIWLQDFKEIPVSIDEFICSPEYLGNTNRNGEAVYPFWRDTVREIFNAGNTYNEIILSGATRIGKTSTATIIVSYMLYRLMLYRDPHEYFKKKQVSKFTIAFANLTQELAKGVAFREFNDTLKQSPWFNEHGQFSRSDRNFYYIPEGDKIDIVPASDAAHLLGMQIWCLVGGTKIMTPSGVMTLEDAANSYQEMLQLNAHGELDSCVAPVLETKRAEETIRITLEDGSTIEGTPEHQVMLSDGTYKSLRDLTEDDDLLTFNIGEVDQMNFKSYDSKFLVYVHTSPNGKKYVGITSKSCEERWRGGSGYRDNLHFYNAIQKYGWDSFLHEVVASDLSLEDACALESFLINKFDTMNPDCGYNHTTGGNWATPDEPTRKKISRALKRVKSDPKHRKHMSDVLKGHPVSAETRKKIADANRGRSTGRPAWNSGLCMSEEFCSKLRGRPSWCKGLTKETDERVAKISEKQRGRTISEETRSKLSATQKRRYAEGFSPVWVTDGKIETYIQEGEPVPAGFRLGRLNICDTFIHKNDEMKKVPSSEVMKYTEDGWSLGRGDVGDAIRKGQSRYSWEYMGQIFKTSIELATYLNENGYPKIVGSTITSLYNKGFNTSKIYSSLDGKIRKVYSADENSEN